MRTTIRLALASALLLMATLFLGCAALEGTGPKTVDNSEFPKQSVMTSIVVTLTADASKSTTGSVTIVGTGILRRNEKYTVSPGDNADLLAPLKKGAQARVKTVDGQRSFIVESQ